MGDGAGAVGDGKGAGLSDGVGLVVHGDVGGLRAVGRVDVDDLGDGAHGAVGGSSGNGSAGEENNGLGEHFEGVGFLFF